MIDSVTVTLPNGSRISVRGDSQAIAELFNLTSLGEPLVKSTETGWYYSKSRRDWVRIADMDTTHILRAIAKYMREERIEADDVLDILEGEWLEDHRVVGPLIDEITSRKLRGLI